MSQARNAKRFVLKHREFLTKTIHAFIEDSKNQQPEKIKELHKQYEKIWIDYANKENHGNSILSSTETKALNASVLVDAFEDSTCNKAIASIKKRSRDKLPLAEYNELLRILYVVKHPSFLQKLFPNFFQKNLEPTLKRV